jgi:MSHA biogenesis protein MshJ
VSLANLPVESLSQPASQPSSQPAGAKTDAPLADDDRGPFLHPVEIVVEGDYASVVAYLRAAESLPWRIQWRKLELTAGEYPVNRVRLVIGALSLSRDWLSV